MEIIREIYDRQSTRKYKNIPVKDEDILALIEAARLAPSGNNTQPWRFMIIRDKEKMKRICAADASQAWMQTAPVFIACLADLRCRMNVDETCSVDDDCPDPDLKRIIRDSAIAVGFLLLEAQHRGLGTCWTGWYEQNEMRKALEIPAYYHVSGIVTVGYPDEAPRKRIRRSLEDLILK